MALKLSTFAGLVLGAAAQPDIVLATFDGAKGTTFKWHDQNDPVMGGKSTSTFGIKNDVGLFNGTCAIVPSLQAPGFCKVTTSSYFHPQGDFNDASSAVNGAIQLKVRSQTPSFAGFRVAFGSPNVPRSRYGGGSYKSGFLLSGDGSDWEVVTVPMNTFSYDWSGFTGTCDTTDPDGTKHHCCGKGEDAKYCPTAESLGDITDLEIWAEGAEGDFELEVEWVGAVNDSPESSVDRH